MKLPAIFLDRDGVINEKLPEGKYVTKWEEFTFLPGVFEALHRLKNGGFLIIVVTNQRAVAKGLISMKELEKIHRLMVQEIQRNGGDIDGIYVCPHDDSDDCFCRKPKPGLILQAIEDFEKRNILIDVNKSYLIGDSIRDILAGKKVGLSTIKLGSDYCSADYHFDSLLEAVEYILSNAN